MEVYGRADHDWKLVGNARLATSERGGRNLHTLRMYFPSQGSATELVDFGEIDMIRTVSARLDADSRLLERYRNRIRAQMAEPVVLYHWDSTRTAMSLPDDPGMLARYQAFKRESALPGATSELESPESYTRTCSPCHAEKVEYFLKHDHHVHAMDTLRGLGDGSHKNPACVTCHTTPRAKTNQAAADGEYVLHEGILCGSCHTDADSHARQPSLSKPLTVGRSLCESCHNSVQSPNYDHDAYWKQLGCVTFKAK